MTLFSSLPAAIQKQSFGQTTAGEAIEIYTLTNRQGTEARVMTYGGIVVSLKTKDRSGVAGDIVHGFDSLAGYESEHPYFGALIGRYGNRIAKGQFKLNGKAYTLAKNNNENHLHGGLRGFDKRVWTAEVRGSALVLTYVSADGEEGYPGRLKAQVTYTLSDTDELRLDYAATSDQDTVVNLTNHSYFNLSGESTIGGHEVKIEADRFTPVDSGLIPTGELRPVAGTPFDFRKFKAVGERIDAAEEQIRFGGGYDHNFVLNGSMGTLRKAAEVYSPASGRVLEVSTTEPGVQFYTGNFLDGSLKGKGGRVYQKRSALCLETQHFPDSPNHLEFPTTTLRKGDHYKSSTVWKFSTR